MNADALDHSKLRVTLNALSIQSLHELVLDLRQNAITTTLLLFVEHNGGWENELVLNWVPLWSAISHNVVLKESDFEK